MANGRLVHYQKKGEETPIVENKMSSSAETASGLIEGAFPFAQATFHPKYVVCCYYSFPLVGFPFLRLISLCSCCRSRLALCCTVERDIILYEGMTSGETRAFGLRKVTITDSFILFPSLMVVVLCFSARFWLAIQTKSSTCSSLRVESAWRYVIKNINTSRIRMQDCTYKAFQEPSSILALCRHALFLGISLCCIDNLGIRHISYAFPFITVFNKCTSRKLRKVATNSEVVRVFSRQDWSCQYFTGHTG